MASFYFNRTTHDYLINSFKKANITEENVNRLFDFLSTPPKWTTIRINTLRCTDNKKSIDHIQTFLNDSYKTLNEMLNSEHKVETPICYPVNELVNECIIFKSSVNNKLTIKELGKCVIIDPKCGQAIMRGADIFIPGVIGVSLNAKANDEVSIYVDLFGKCLKGADANKFLSTGNNLENTKFVGNGWLMFDRDEIFKNSDSLKSGIGVKTKQLLEFGYIPSFDQLDDDGKFYLQNLPSIICARVLEPKENESILDMCSAPGGKTIHLASIIANKGCIIAFDKISSKIKKMKELCERHGASCIQCFTQDSTKIDFDVYKPELFDKILVDAPCSALGQRPLLYNEITINQLVSYTNYQRNILDNAVKLVKPGGIIVYSTCTITLEENEEQVSWLLNKYKSLELLSQEPFIYASSKGIKTKGLNDEQLNLLQRFMPNISKLHNKGKNEDFENVYNDCNGFFIAKFRKKIN